ncbi:MAG: hypothetical protein AAF530_09875 [Pseudomonadota bacterium]
MTSSRTDHSSAAKTNYVAQISETFLKEAERIASRYRIALPTGRSLVDFVPVLSNLSDRASADEIEKLRIAALMTADDGLDYLKADYITSSLRAFRDHASRPPSSQNLRPTGAYSRGARKAA